MRFTTQLTIGYSLAILLTCSLNLTAIAQESPRAAVFQRLDKNQDGKISREEAKGTTAEQRFNALDRNKDGFLTPDESPRGRAAPESTDTADKGGFVTKMDIRYAEVPPGVNAHLLSLDVYAPKDARNLPVMIYIHGGGWRTGDKKAAGTKPAYFTERGFVFVSLNYRLVPSVDILTQLQDSANAIGWVKKNIAQHGGDPSRLHLIGHSAGAHHVAILATNQRFLQEAGVALADLKSVVELDTQALDVPELMRGSDNALYLQAFGKDPAVWPQVSPRDNVAKDKGIPPFFLVVANERGPKLAQAAAFQKALHAAGVRCEFVEAPQHDHGSLNRAIGEKDDKVTKVMEKFHDSILDNKASAAGVDSLRIQNANDPSPVRAPALPDGATMHEWVKSYAALGEHRAASEVDAKTVDWLGAELRRAGLKVTFQAFTVPQFQLSEVRLTVVGKAVAAFPRWPVRATSGTVSGPLATEKTSSLQGCIVLLDTDRETRRATDTRLKKLVNGGAVGVIQIVTNTDGDFAAENVSKPAEEPPPIPVVVVGSRDRESLRIGAARGDSTTISIAGEWQPQAQARNVIATLDRGPIRIVVSTPCSGWFRCGGERGSGLAVFLALAHWAAAQDSQTSFTFVANSAHELGYAGMVAYLDGPAPPAKDVLAWLHLGANAALLPEARPAARDGKARLFTSRPDWEPPLAEVMGDVAELLRNSDRSRGTTLQQPNGELRLVLPKGYTGLNLAGGGNRWMHAPGDGPETTGPAVLEPVARALAAALERITNQQP
jgi:acetyl esterase/lipase